MVRVDLAAGLALRGLDHVGEQRRVDLGRDADTGVAHDALAGLVVDQGVGAVPLEAPPPPSEAVLARESLLHQELQGPVHGGETHGRVPFLHTAVQLLRGDVPVDASEEGEVRRRVVELSL